MLVWWVAPCWSKGSAPRRPHHHSKGSPMQAMMTGIASLGLSATWHLTGGFGWALDWQFSSLSFEALLMSLLRPFLYFIDERCQPPSVFFPSFHHKPHPMFRVTHPNSFCDALLARADSTLTVLRLKVHYSLHSSCISFLEFLCSFSCFIGLCLLISLKLTPSLLCCLPSRV